MKLSSQEEARKEYESAIVLDPYDANALVGLGRYHELRSDWKSASGYYRRSLELEPGNSVARAGLRKAEANTLDDAGILAELKLRGVLAPQKTAVSEEDRALFRQLRQAEEMGAIDYLVKKFNHMPPGYSAEKDPGTGFYRLLLTARGFAAYRGLLTREAMAFFEGRKILAKNVLRLRDTNGNLLFDKDTGLLTPDGMTVYYFAQAGQKRYLLPSEPSPAKAQLPSGEDDKIARNETGKKYMEITEPEYLWLVRATDCSDETFVNDLAMDIFTNTGADGKKTRRYFVDNAGHPLPCCVPASYVARYRLGDATIPGMQGNSFFGTGGVSGHKLCKSDGKLWKGEIE